MKTRVSQPLRARTAERGFAVFFLLALLGIMAILVASNTRNLNWLHQEIKLVEKHQLERLDGPATNRAPAKITTPNPRSKP